MVKRYVIVGNEAQIIRELSTQKPIVSSLSGSSPVWGSSATGPQVDDLPSRRPAIPITECKGQWSRGRSPSLLEIGRRAAMSAEREAIERVLTQTRWNRRQAAKILKISYKALLNKLKIIEEQSAGENKNLTA